MSPLQSAGLLVLLASAHASAAMVKTAPVKAPVLIPGISAPAIAVSPISPLSLGPASAISWDGAPSLPNISLPVPAAPALTAAPSLEASPSALPDAPAPDSLQEVQSFMEALKSPIPGTDSQATDKGMESLHQDGSAAFDGLAKQKGAVDAEEREGDFPAGWTPGELRSPADNAVLRYRSRRAPAAGRAPPTVFVGGLALAESYDSYFKTQAAAGDEHFLWLRGHQPSAWTPTRSVYDNDARDLAAMIVAAARSSGSGKVRLVAHSYGVLVFQRMLQLTEHAEVRQALSLLKGSRVTLLNVTTHYGDSETVAGEEYAQMAKIIRAFIGWLDLMDSQAAFMRKSMEFNPALAPMVLPALMAWEIQRTAALSMASQGAVQQLKDHLAQRWDPSIDSVRRRILRVIGRNSGDPGWQEAFLRRANDTSKLDFKPADVARLRKLGIGLDLIHSKDDQLIPWPS
ncbi:MAG: alpha/beta hydrolase, partial [Elusimicrobiota bacterium]